MLADEGRDPALDPLGLAAAEPGWLPALTADVRDDGLSAERGRSFEADVGRRADPGRLPVGDGACSPAAEGGRDPDPDGGRDPVIIHN